MTQIKVKLGDYMRDSDIRPSILSRKEELAPGELSFEEASSLEPPLRISIIGPDGNVCRTHINKVGIKNSYLTYFTNYLHAYAHARTTGTLTRVVKVITWEEVDEN